jgi:hypothetical protein
MKGFAAHEVRPVDILFVGGFSRHHRRRAEILEAIASEFAACRVVFHLDQSRLTRLAESPLGWIPPLRQHRRPSAIRRVSQPPVFGRSLYAAIADAKIVLNGAVDMAGLDRGNMRCFEALGCGALMVSDAGNYPAGMVNGETMLTYETPQDAVRIIRSALAEPDSIKRIAKAGANMLEAQYGKHRQWLSFQQLVAEI